MKIQLQQLTRMPFDDLANLLTLQEDRIEIISHTCRQVHDKSGFGRDVLVFGQMLDHPETSPLPEVNANFVNVLILSSGVAGNSSSSFICR